MEMKKEMKNAYAQTADFSNDTRISKHIILLSQTTFWYRTISNMRLFRNGATNGAGSRQLKNEW